MGAGFIALVAAADVLLGVLEHPQCKPGATRAVRVLFAREGERWTSLAGGDSVRRSPLPTEWTVSFDGRSLGRVTTRDPGWQSEYPWTYPRDRLLDVVGTAPTVPNRDGSFAGWCEAPAGRPLVVVSQANVADPAGWRRSTAPSDFRTRLFPLFKARAGQQMRCPIGAEKGVDLDYTAKDLTVMAAYTDRQERRLIAVGLDPALNTCDDQSEPASRPHWFVIPRDVEPVWLGDGLRLVDAGDYDRDGHSELLFWFSGYNHDGYVLFADELATRVDYLWHYH